MRMVLFLLGFFLVAVPVSAQSDVSQAKILRKLDTQRASFQFDHVPLEEVLDYFQEWSGINFVLHLDGSSSPSVSLRLTQVRLKTALRLILGKADLAAVYRKGAIVVCPRDRLRSRMMTKVYDVHDLLLKIRDFPGPQIQLSENESGIDPGLLPDIPRACVGKDLLVDLVVANAGGNSWRRDRSSITLVNGLLVVSQTAQVHREIHTLLTSLRGAR